MGEFYISDGKTVVPFDEELREYIGYSCVANYLMRYLRDIDAKTCVIEEKYVDKDYLVDYQLFYSRSFEDIKRYTLRLHFFKNVFSEDELRDFILKGSFEKLKESYLGFVVVKPICDESDQPLIGRTALKPYPEEDDGKKRFFIKCRIPVCLFGMKKDIETLPYQQQDRGVSACATIALWTCLFPLSNLFKIPRQSPAEITKISTRCPAPHRRFPSVGLTLEQILRYIGEIGLDNEVLLDIEGDKVPLVVKAYLNAGLPLLALLKFSKGSSSPDWHAVVISGYKTNESGEIEELYVHDDQIGPYSRVKPNHDFKFWKNEWLGEYSEIELKHLVIPVYEKIRLTFPKLYAFYEKYKTTFQEKFKDISEYLKFELFLSSIQEYKYSLTRENIENKWEILKESFPHYIWIIRASIMGRRIWEDIFDATSTRVRSIENIYYRF